MNFKLMNNIKLRLKNTGTATADTFAENYRTRHPCDRRESVC